MGGDGPGRLEAVPGATWSRRSSSGDREEAASAGIVGLAAPWVATTTTTTERIDA